MKKDELRALRSLNATPGMFTAMKNTDARIYARAQCLGPFVKIAFFYRRWLEKGIRTPVTETFINRDGKEWISRILDEKGKEVKWSDAMVQNLECMRNAYYFIYSGLVADVWVTSDTFETVRRFEGRNWSRRECMRAVQRWQENIRAEKIEEKERKEQQPWDEDMALIPKVPEGLREWMHKECCNQFFLVYKYQKGQKEAYCTRCGSTVRIEGLKNNVAKICPKCKVKAICKSEGVRMHTESTAMHYAKVIQKVKGGIVERLFERMVGYRCKDFRKPNEHFLETKRVLILDGREPRKYEWGTYKNKYTRWIRNDYFDKWGYGSLYRFPAKLYPRTLAAAMGSDVMKKSTYALWEQPPLDLYEYVVTEKGCPPVEMLARIGMFTMAEGLIKARYDKDLLKEDETELAKILKIDNMRLKRLKAMEGAGITELRWMQREKMQDTIWPDELIEEFGTNHVTWGDLSFLPHKAMTEVQVWNYLRKQEKVTGESMKDLIVTWDDYICMAGTLKMDVNNSMIYKPKNLRYAHDECVILKNTKGMEAEAKKLEKKFPKVNAQLKKLGKFEYKNGKYQVIAPKKVLDIVREGRILGHCVHTCDYYFSRISTDESYLFFLRKTERPDMPWYTMEVEPSGNIRQKRTTGDRQNRDFEEAVEFLKKWQKHFRKQLTKQEKALGAKSDELRKKNYALLREEAKRVWHGPLAGQLLADVLEADFMEAI